MPTAHYQVFMQPPNEAGTVKAQGNRILLAIHNGSRDLRKHLIDALTDLDQTKTAGIIRIDQQGLRPESVTELNARAEFFNPSHPIQLCGHGFHQWTKIRKQMATPTP